MGEERDRSEVGEGARERERGGETERRKRERDGGRESERDR